MERIQVNLKGEQPSECSHEPDAHTIVFASQTDLICDVSCGKCGRSGSFRVDPTSIQWEATSKWEE